MTMKKIKIGQYLALKMRRKTTEGPNSPLFLSQYIPKNLKNAKETQNLYDRYPTDFVTRILS
jgi:hypothetical protein